MASPSKFAHIVYRTHRYQEMIDWYQRVFDAKVQNQTDMLSFLTYDEEHHRFAFLNLGGTPSDDKPDQAAPGVHHVAYTWDNVKDLMAQYEKMCGLGCKPFMSVRHGPTLSMYYEDPDGNGLEFQVDLLSADEANSFMQGDAFHANPIGEPFDPDQLVQALASRQDILPLVIRSDQGEPPGGVPLG
jgi:catechol-2,3-dioxygenase